MIPLLIPAQQCQLVLAQPLILWNSLHVLYHQMLFAWFIDGQISFQFSKQDIVNQLKPRITITSLIYAYIKVIYTQNYKHIHSLQIVKLGFRFSTRKVERKALYNVKQNSNLSLCSCSDLNVPRHHGYR